MPLIESDSFQHDPFGWVGNQSGHGWIGVAIGLPMLALGCPLPLALTLTWVLYYLVFEMLLQGLVLPMDSFSDSLHPVFGLSVVGLLPNYDQALLVMGGWGLVLAYGFWRRT